VSKIPEARALLREALPTMPSPWREQVEAALGLMRRRAPAKRPAPARKRQVDAALAARIRAYVAAHPGEHLQDVAAVFGVNPGRVSEALHGDR
jgi:hypothetical protein